MILGRSLAKVGKHRNDPCLGKNRNIGKSEQRIAGEKKSQIKSLPDTPPTVNIFG